MFMLELTAAVIQGSTCGVQAGLIRPHLSAASSRYRLVKWHNDGDEKEGRPSAGGEGAVGGGSEEERRRERQESVILPFVPLFIEADIISALLWPHQSLMRSSGARVYRYFLSRAATSCAAGIVSKCSQMMMLGGPMSTFPTGWWSACSALFQRGTFPVTFMRNVNGLARVDLNRSEPLLQPEEEHGAQK